MINEQELLEYTKEYYPTEDALIARSMVNYYDLKLREEKSEGDALHQEKIFEGVLDLFEVLSNQLATELDADATDIFKMLKSIHIKT